MNERGFELIQLIVSGWKLDRQTATLLTTALRAVARCHSSMNVSKTIGILMAYNAAGLIDEATYQEGYALVDAVTRTATASEALNAIFNYFAAT